MNELVFVDYKFVHIIDFWKILTPKRILPAHASPNTTNIIMCVPTSIINGNNIYGNSRTSIYDKSKRMIRRFVIR